MHQRILRSQGAQFVGLVGMMLVVVAASEVEPISQDSGSVSITDPIGDVTGQDGRLLPGRSSVDITGLEVSVQGSDLAVQFSVAEPLLEGEDIDAPHPRFTVDLDTTSDGVLDSAITIFLSSGFVSSDSETWRARLYREGRMSVPMQAPTIDGDTASVALPLESVSVSDEIRFKARTEAFQHTSETGTQMWVDHVPDSRRLRRLETGVQGGVGNPQAQASQPLEHIDVRDLNGTTSSERTIEQVRRDLETFLSTRPDTTDLLGLEFGFTDRSFALCADELASGGYERGLPVPTTTGCGVAYLSLYIAYADTKEPEVESLLRDFVGATVSQLPSDQRAPYLELLEDGIAQLEDYFPGVFAPGAVPGPSPSSREPTAGH